MLRYRGYVSLALFCAFLSSLGLSAGIAGILPILETMQVGDEKSQAKGLPELAADFNAWTKDWMFDIPQSWIDQLPTGPMTAIVWVVAGLSTVTIFMTLMQFAHMYLSITVVFRTVTQLRQDAFDRVIRLPLRKLVNDGTSDMIARVISDTGQLAGGFSALLSKGVNQVAKGMAGLMVAFVIDWRLSLAACTAGPLIAIVIRVLGKRIRRATKRALDVQGELYAHAIDAIRSARVVKVHTTEQTESERFEGANRKVMRYIFKARTARAMSSPLVEGVSIIVLGVLSTVAVKLVLDGHLEPGRLFLTLAGLFVAGASLRPLTGLANEIHLASAAANRVDELLGADLEPGHEPGLPTAPSHEKELRFEGVRFTYPNAETPAINGVDLSIKRGERVAFVGPNGCGKTTLLSLVPRLFDPDEGAVLLDGQDLRGLNITSVRAQIGVVTQETVLFRGTIASNIAYGVDGASGEAIRAAARQARATDFIERLPDGFDEVVGEQGLTLSGGQRQRISIARAIIRDPSILILDEATSMVDAESESQIAEAMNEFAAGRTTLVVAHRLSTVVNADRIVVLNFGEIVDVGTHDELLERCDIYATLAKTQLITADS